MNNSEAAQILGLIGTITKADTKAAYRKACTKFHPDKNPSGTEMMKAVNLAYEQLKEFQGELEETSGANYGDKMSDALNSILDLDGIEVEVCGSWIWVTGETKTHKQYLKESGFFYAAKKKAWYLKPEGTRKRRGQNWDMDKIRGEHGSQVIRKTNNRKQLAKAS